MNSFVSRLAKFLKNRYLPRGGKVSFAKDGEDIIIEGVLASMGIQKPTYLDIGAHHPVFANNTYLFYRHGGRGVILEPNKNLCRLIQKQRPRDVCLNAGAGGTDDSLPFYAFSQDTRSTFSKEQALEWERGSGQKPVISEIPLFSLNTILERNFDSVPDVISIDAEGYDLEILNNFSFNSRPKVFCVETAIPGEGNTLSRNKDIYDIFKKHGYTTFAETPANTIFIDTVTTK